MLQAAPREIGAPACSASVIKHHCTMHAALTKFALDENCLCGLEKEFLVKKFFCERIFSA
jgi:hypothetical protein